MNTRLWVVSGSTVVAVLAALLLSLGQHDHNHAHEHDHEEHFAVQMTPEQLQKYEIAVEEVTPGILKRVVQAPALIVIPTDQQGHIYPKASGIVVEVNKNLGEDVEFGETLATLESQEVAAAKASFLAALKQETLKGREYTREQKLADKNISSQQEYAASENAWEESKINLELARHGLYALGFNSGEIDAIERAPGSDLSRFEVKSPLQGKVLERNLTKGALVNKDQEIFEVGNVDKLWAEVNVFPQDRQFVSQGQTVSISSEQGQISNGVVLFLSPTIDSTTHTSKVIVLLDNAEGKWLPGSFSNATIITQETPVSLTVCKEAIQNIDGNDCVFVTTDDGFAMRPITRGEEDLENVEVLSGLEPGEKVASTNTFLLKADLLKEEAEHMD